MSETWRQLKRHAPFTAAGTAVGMLLFVALVWGGAPVRVSELLFWGLHPLHVLLSAMVTTAVYVLHSRGRFWATLTVGYAGSVGIATLSDSVMPFLGEMLLGLQGEVHLGFIEKWWLVNPLALAGIALGRVFPATTVPHAGHVLLSTWASLTHITMAIAGAPTWTVIAAAPVVLFLSVWVPCCTSDIVFPMLFAPGGRIGTNA